MSMVLQRPRVFLLLFLVTWSAQSVGRATHAATPPAELTQGVESIASAGVPGPLAVFDERAFVVVAGSVKGDVQLPVVVGATWGRGKVIAFGHGGMIGSEALKHDGIAALVEHAVRWMAGRKANPHVAVAGNQAMLSMLSTRGFDTIAIDRVTDVALESVDVIVIDSHRVRDDEMDTLARFVKRGGGLITGGLGWGWLQLNPGKTIHDHPGNRLLRDAGIAWCDGTVSTTQGDAFAVHELPKAMHALSAMDDLDRALTGNGAFSSQAGGTLTSALRVVPENNPLYRRASRLMQSHGGSLVVSESAPLSLKDGAARVLLALQVESEKRTPASRVRAHPSSSAFPGEVPRDAKRVQRVFSVDLSTPGWHSTGLYAPAGEVISIQAQSDTHRCAVRIGCHTDQNWHHDAWKRVPDISRQWPLEQGETNVASAFGGLLYVDVPRGLSGSAEFTINGAVEAPRFVLGETSLEAWRSIRNAPAPWGELETSKVIISVPSSALRSLDDPESLMRFWDQISDAHATLAAIPLDPERPHRFVPDVQISAGYMHSGYPIMTHLDAVEPMTRLEQLRRGSWGLLHELGHNHQEGDWTFGGTVEVTCNLFALHAIDTICSPEEGDRGHGGVNTPPSLEQYLADGAPFDQWKRDPFLALHMYVQLEAAFGWETFKRVFAEYRTLGRDERPKNDGEKRDQWMVRFSRACERNLGPFFEAWGVPTSPEARASIADLADWMPEDWPQN